MSIKLFIVAGESSGDRHGARLVAELRRCGDYEIRGVGGPMMKEQGVELLADITAIAVIGSVEVLRNYRRYRRVFDSVLDFLERERPAAVILIDFPGFNIRLAKQVKKRGLPVKVIYYISPQVWAWGGRRKKTIAGNVDKMIVILPFEVDVYRGTGLDVEFVGHPLMDSTACPRGDLRKTLGVGDGLIIGLLPGSRGNEVEKLLPVMLGSARLIGEKIGPVHYVLPARLSLDAGTEERLLSSGPVAPLRADAHMIMDGSDLVIVASGTATLECAIFETPMVIIYKVSLVTAFLARLLIMIPYIGLVNIVAGRRIVPELLQFRALPRLIAEEVVSILEDRQRYGRMKAELAGVREALGEPGASLRAAKIITGLVES